MKSLSFEREIILDYRVRWLGLLPLTLWFFHVVYNFFVRMTPWNLAWMCHVTGIVLAIGLIGSFVSLVRLVSAWVLLGLPIWLIEALSVGAPRISVLSHLLLPIVIVVAMMQVRETRPVWMATLQSLALHAAVWVFARFFTPPRLNINVAHREYLVGGKPLIGDFVVYTLITMAACAAICAAMHLAFKKRYPAEIKEQESELQLSKEVQEANEAARAAKEKQDEEKAKERAKERQALAEEKAKARLERDEAINSGKFKRPGAPPDPAPPVEEVSGSKPRPRVITEVNPHSGSNPRPRI